jgi:hypothetical protein
VSTSRPIWQGLIHIRPEEVGPDLLDGASAAYVNVLGLAYDASEYRERVVAQLLSDRLVVTEWQDVSAFDPEDRELDERLEEARDRLSDEWPVQYGTFHTYSHEDA